MGVEQEAKDPRGGVVNPSFVEVPLGKLPQQGEDVVDGMKAEDLDMQYGKNKKNKKGKKSKDGKKKEEPEYPAVSFFRLFRFSTAIDKVIIFFGVIAAIICGTALPAMVILFGRLINNFVANDYDINEICAYPGVGPKCCTANATLNLALENCDVTQEQLADIINEGINFTEGVKEFVIGMSIVGIVTFLSSYFYVLCLNMSAENQVHTIRQLFFQSILRQNIGWYDTQQTSGLAVKMTDNLNKLQEGIGEKIGMFIYFMSTSVISLVLAFVYGWELTLVMLSPMPIVMIAMGFIAKSQTSLAEGEMSTYSLAGAIAEEVLGSIRTVLAFGGEKKEIQRYKQRLLDAKKATIVSGLLTGIGTGVTFFMMFASYSLAFWYGVKLIIEDREACFEDPNNCKVRYDPGSLLIIFFSVLMGSMSVGQSAPYVEAFSVAKAAAGGIFHIIDRVPEIDSLSDGGLKPGVTTGNIIFKDVHFNYPSRPEVKILQGLNLTIEKGQTVALVGHSGCGKSTVIQLIQRFYDPLSGSVSVHGVDIKDLNLNWLRERIGVVGQEPVLFGCSIADNIRQGKENVTLEEIERACIEANAYDFIMKLPKTFDTLVGEKGAQLSGGQKQRIAIARALVRNPEIMLLDEATSALDTHSESVVQSALEKAQSGRTTIVVAHRLSTIRNANKIVVFEDGRVAEAGTHNELMKMKSLYHSLVVAQSGNEGVQEGQGSTDNFQKNDYLEDKSSAEANSYSKLDRLNSVGSIQSQGMVHDEAAMASKEVEKLTTTETIRLFKLNAKEWPYILVGILCSMAMGGAMPFYGILFGDVLGELSKPADEAKAGSEFYSLMFLVIGIVIGLVAFIQGLMFSISGGRLTMRVRELAFEAMLRQEVGWFDQQENSTGALCGRLSSDAGAIQGATGPRIGNAAQAVFTIILAVGIAVYFNWKLGLVTCLFVPVLLIGVAAQAKIIASHGILDREALESSTNIAVEAISNVRTVAGLGREKSLVDRYMAALTKSKIQVRKQSHIRGLVFGFAQSSMFIAYATALGYGGYLVDNEGLPYEDCFKVAEGLIAASFVVGQAVAFAPDANKAMAAAGYLFKLLDRKPQIDSDPAKGLQLNNVDGNIEFKGATFSYPTRSKVNVLRNLNLAIQRGHKVALVGQSGCGKSTCIQLLQRFYNLKGGELAVDEQNIEGLNVPSLRSKLGIVSQEPVLFDRTIAENIMYGDNERQVSMDEVVEASRKANIHSFVTSLPEAYDTRVGEKGVQMSGGQKQRVAIARALVRNPTILLLDEATSALDMKSEKVVQEALDKAQVGRTCITIAHRLSTIQSADVIFVINKGNVEEIGTHNELLRQQGIYANLWLHQGGEALVALH